MHLRVEGFIRFSTPLDTMWLAMQPKGCRLTTLFTPVRAKVTISAGRTSPRRTALKGR